MTLYYHLETWSSFDWSSFIPDLVISLITLAIPLLIQHHAIVKPLIKKNNELQKNIDIHTHRAIGEYLTSVNQTRNDQKNDMDSIISDMEILIAQSECDRFTQKEIDQLSESIKKLKDSNEAIETVSDHILDLLHEYHPKNND